jgi:aryl-alcohol dehydrogenase-like predicted oxidoreductase
MKEIEVLVGIGAEHGLPAAQVALAHTRGKPAVTSLIAGARGDPAQRA